MSATALATPEREPIGPLSVLRSAGGSLTEGGWVVMPPNVPNPLCQHHDGLCCYWQDQTDRCPWCHSSWGAILSTEGHWCEKPGAWSNGRDPNNETRKAWHVSMAVQMRAEAAQERWQGTSTPRVTKETLALANAGCQGSRDASVTPAY